MKYKVMRKWVNALRSGKFKQGQHALSKDGNYCCLGVLCEISKVGRASVGFQGHIAYGIEAHIGILPSEVQKAAGMRSNTGYIIGESCDLISLNDTGKSFNEIADVIEKHWKDL